MIFKELYENLEINAQISLATDLIEIGLPIWEDYFKENPIEYQDSVVGMQHKIDNNLIIRSIFFSRKLNNKNNFLVQFITKLNVRSLYKEIREPVVARQDDDFEVPYGVELILYSTYNLIDYILGNNHTLNEKNKLLISINQSISAITKSGIMDDEQLSLFIKGKTN